MRHTLNISCIFVSIISTYSLITILSTFASGMKLAVIIVSLFTTLICGSTPLLAAGKVADKQQVLFHTLYQNSFSHSAKKCTTNVSAKDDENFLQHQFIECEEVEDEDGSTQSSRKTRPTIGIHSLPSYPSIFSLHNFSAKYFSTTWLPISATYLRVRSLRI
jgi:hypothetical protein